MVVRDGCISELLEEERVRSFCSLVKPFSNRRTPLSDRIRLQRLGSGRQSGDDERW